MNNIDQYIESRVLPRINWYDKRAVSCKRKHFLLQFVSIVGSVSLLFLLHFEGISHIWLAFIASLITLSVAIERIGKYSEHWMSYRLAAEALASELELFRQIAGPYVNDVDCSKKFVARTEKLLSKEALNWSSVIERNISSKSDSGIIND